MKRRLRGLRKGIRQRFRRKHLPVLLIPITRGPLDNYFHFLFGYFVPLYWWAMKNPDSKTAVVTVSPYAAWLDLLPGRTPKRLDPLKAMKQSFLKNKAGFSPDYRVEGFSGWDKWEKFESRPLREVSDHLSRSFEDSFGSPVGADAVDIIVVLRSHRPTFLPNRPEVRYGATKRNVPNLEDLVLELDGEYATKAVDPGSLSPKEALDLFSRAKLVVGQHGAGLSNCFFMPPGRSVIEISWTGFDRSPYSPIFRLLAHSLSLNYQQIPLQSDPFSPVNVGQLRDAIVDEMKKLERFPRTHQS